MTYCGASTNERNRNALSECTLMSRQSAFLEGNLDRPTGPSQWRCPEAGAFIRTDPFRSRTSPAANLLTLLLYALLGGILFFFPVDLIQVQHYLATLSEM